MILEEIKAAVESRVRRWAQAQSVPVPESLPFAQPPAHVAADLSLPWPLQAAKALRRKPLDIAGELATLLADLPGATAQAAPPGFVNLRLSSKALTAGLLPRVLSAPGRYGAASGLKARSILLEFVSANPTGPLHLASGRAATLGDSLARILKRIGHKAGSEYYVNDAGGRVELLGESLRARFNQVHGEQTPVPEKGYQGEYLLDMARALPPEADSWDAKAFGRFAMDRLLASHKADMESFGVDFDRWFHESELYAGRAVEKTLAFLKSRGMTYEKDGAVWLGTQGVEGSEDDKDRVLVKSGGQPTYFLPDIAYHKDKFDRGWTEVIDIWGADHHGYVPRMKAAVAALGKPPEAFHAIVHQLVHLCRGTEAVKMSKRAGEFVTLKDLVDEVGRDACRFFFALRTSDSHMNFDLELAKKQTSENPVYYVQYVHARIASILREAAKTGLGPGDSEPSGTLPLDAAEERALLVKLAWFPETLRACERELSPHPLAGYLMELSGLFHPFYEECRVVDAASPELSRARLMLCRAVGTVIAEGLGLLGVSAPDKM